MANQPRADNPHRSVRVDDQLWETARIAAAKEDTTRGDIMRQALRELVKRHVSAVSLDNTGRQPPN